MAQQRLGFDDEVVEVHHVAVREPSDVFPIQPRFICGERVLLEAVTPEPAQHPAPPLAGYAQAVQDDVLILLVRDAESSFKTHLLGVFAQQRQTQRVDRPARDCLSALAKHRLQTVGDLLGGAVRERDGTDAMRIDP